MEIASYLIERWEVDSSRHWRKDSSKRRREDYGLLLGTGEDRVCHIRDNRLFAHRFSGGFRFWCVL